MDKPMYEKQFCLYIDVLGVKEGLKTSPNNVLLALDEVYGYIKDDNTFYNGFQNHFDNDNKTNCREIKIFSDNIAVVHNLTNKNDDDKEETDEAKREKTTVLHNLILDALEIQKYLLLKGYTCRGGIAFGDCCINEKLIIGQGLVSAYNFENKAVYPRIVIDKDLIKILHYKDKPLVIYDDKLKVWYIDFIKWFLSKDNSTNLKIINNFIEEQQNITNKKIRKIRKFKEIKEIRKIRKKYKWLKGQVENYTQAE